MRKLSYMLGVTLLLISSHVFAFQCTDIFNQNPGVISVCHTAYQSFMSKSEKIPVAVRYDITPDQANCTARKGNFMADPLISRNYQASDSIYLHSGYDVGHMFPAEDAGFNPLVEKESFYYTNAIPQLPAFNRGKWKSLETRIRKVSYSNTQTFEVIAGPLSGRVSVTGKLSQIGVPSRFYKIIIDHSVKEVLIYTFTYNDSTALSNADISVVFPTDLPKEITDNLATYKIRKTFWVVKKVYVKQCIL